MGPDQGGLQVEQYPRTKLPIAAWGSQWHRMGDSSPFLGLDVGFGTKVGPYTRPTGHGAQGLGLGRVRPLEMLPAQVFGMLLPVGDPSGHSPAPSPGKKSLKPSMPGCFVPRTMFQAFKDFIKLFLHCFLPKGPEKLNATEVGDKEGGQNVPRPELLAAFPAFATTAVQSLPWGVLRRCW